MNQVPHWCLLPAVGSGGDLHEAGKRGINIMCVGFPLSIADLKLIKMLIYSIFPSGLFDKYVMNMCVKTRCMSLTTTYTKPESCDNICTKGWYRSSSTDTAETENYFSTDPVAHALPELHWWHVSCTWSHFQMLQVMVWLFDSTEINSSMEGLPFLIKICSSFLFCSFLYSLYLCLYFQGIVSLEISDIFYVF